MRCRFESTQPHVLQLKDALGSQLSATRRVIAPRHAFHAIRALEGRYVRAAEFRPARS